MIDTLSGTFLCTLSHTILLFVICFQQEPHLLANLPDYVQDATEEARIEFVVVLTLSMIANVVELMLLLRVIPSLSQSLFSMTSHCIAILFLFKFVVDQHPVYHFWILFGIMSCPLLLYNAACLGASIKR